jgi:hypothetical protein
VSDLTDQTIVVLQAGGHGKVRKEKIRGALTGGKKLIRLWGLCFILNKRIYASGGSYVLEHRIYEFRQ